MPKSKIEDCLNKFISNFISTPKDKGVSFTSPREEFTKPTTFPELIKEIKRILCI